ncbi:unnamed protein product [Vitrella brassicaformis CCMP3155]|uniref:Methyltransferase type 11 domain-containing protein n=2 Tax=Vitrella brassicaformis TaxID=1169539 RepID=A0A0G4GK40_VITBC|nr:unnamed protein product [Vitrella brassicaformis CCMP3155]|eukprot:CEM30300.1 unnamed protein product [Vitrella brassicaformis CCMP3155]
MTEQLVRSAPPLGDQDAVCDFLCGSGAAGVAFREAYPDVPITFVDSSTERLREVRRRVSTKQAEGSPVWRRVREDGDKAALSSTSTTSSSSPMQMQISFEEGAPVHLHEYAFEYDSPTAIPHAPFDLIIAQLALHVIVGHEHETEGGSEGAVPRYLTVMRYLWRHLKPGGHLLIADHVGCLPCGQQMALLAEGGMFEDVDVAWREGAFFVIGGRKSVSGGATPTWHTAHGIDMNELDKDKLS